MNEINNILEFAEYTEGLKTGLRHSWLSNGRQESTSDHTWRMALLAMLLLPKTGLQLDLEKILKIILIHDLVEIEAKDIPSFMHLNSKELTKQKKEGEEKAISNIRDKIGGETGKEIYDLWFEYENGASDEAVFAKLMDKFEARIQKIQQPLEKWTKEELEDKHTEVYSAMVEKLCNGNVFLLETAEEILRKRMERTAVLK